MKNFGKKFLASLLAVAQIITFTPVNNLTAFAADTTHDGNGTDVNLGISSTFSDGVLTISHIEGNPNSSIKNNSLWSGVKDNITKVVIEEGITAVLGGFGNSSANEACKNLTTVKLPESLTDIGNNAFANCTSLTDVDFSKCINLKYLDGAEQWEFANCTSLKEIDLSNCTKLEKIWDSGFEGCTNLEKVILPNTIKTIDDEAFRDCSKLTTIELPDSLTYIGEHAFRNDTALKNINLNKVQTIRESAFWNSGLTEIYLPESLTRIDSGAFGLCNNLKKISGGKGIQENLANNKKDTTYKHNGEDILDVFLIFNAQNTNSNIPSSPYLEDGYNKNEELIYTNVDNAVDCIKYGNWRRAYRYQFRLRFIDATHTIFDTDKIFDRYTGYFDYYNSTVKAANEKDSDSNVPVKYKVPTAFEYYYCRDKDYAVHTKDGKIYTPSDKWTKGKTGPEVDLTKDTQILEDIDYYLTKYDTDTVTHTVKFKNIKGRDTVEQTYNDGEHLTNIPTDLNYSDTNYNYTFVGWSATTSKDDIVTVDETITVTEDKEYYAIYKQTDKLTLKYVYTTMTNIYNTSLPECGNPFELDSTKFLKDIKSYDNVAVGQKLGSTYEDAPATLTKDNKNYDFVGWYAYYYTGNGDFKSITINADTEISKDNISTDRHNGNSIVYYAIYKYSPKKYKVSFINDECPSENKYGEVESGETYANTYNGMDDIDEYFVPSSNGKTFIGWKVNATNEIVSTKDAIDRVITEDTTFKAVFENNIKFYVAYLTMDNEIDNVEGPTRTSAKVGSKIDFPAMDKKKTSSDTKYVFKGFIKGQANAYTDMTTAEYVDTTNYICTADDTAFTAIYEPETYTVRYIGKDSNGEYTVLKTVHSNKNIILPNNSIITNKSYTKDGKNYEYESGSWYKNNTDKYNYNAEVTITEDTDFYAHYKEVEPTKYTITILNDDGSTIETFEVEENNSFNYSTIPTSKVNQSGKEFMEWIDETGTSWNAPISIDSVTQDKTFTARYKDKTIVKLTFRFFDADNTLIKTSTVMQLSTIFAAIPKPDSNPTKDGYTFKGWRAESDIVKDTDVFSEDTDFYAVFEENAPEKVTARFIDYDDTELDSKEVTKGTTLGDITFTPSRNEDDEFTYTFKAWTVDNNEVTDDYVINEDTTFKATYTATPKQTTPVEPDPDITITVTFKPENGEADTVKTDVVSGSALGTVKIADPVKAEDDKFTYTFAGWKVEENDAVVDDSYVINKDTVFIATYTATRKTYHVIFKDEDGTIIEEKDVPTNTPLGDIKPNDPSKEGKDFKGWDDGTGIKPDDTPITKDTTFTATYEPKELPPTPEEPEKITVIFKDYDGTTIEEKQVNKNSFLGTVKPENPTRTDYKFVGWSKDDVVVDDGYVITEDTTFIATYVTKEIKLIQIDGTLLDKNGKPIANAVVNLHSTVRQTKTDENGYYIFKNVELEEHEINAKVEDKEVYKYNIDATDVENIKKVLESQDENYDVNSNISEKNGIVTITLNAKEKGNETPTPTPEPTPEPVIPTPTPTPTPEPVIPTPTPIPTPEKPKETVTIKFYLDYDLTELFDTVVVNKGEAFTYNKEPEGYKFWVNVDQYVENRVYHNGETIYPMKDMTFYMEKEIKDTPDDSKVIDKPKKDTPKDTPKDNKKVPTPKDNPKEDNKKKEDRDIPKTGDRVLIYVLGLIAGLAILKKKKKND